MSIATIVGCVLLGIVIIGPLLHQPEVTKGKVPPPITPLVSLFVVDGVCYATAIDGSVMAFRVHDGVLLWHHKVGNAGEKSITVASGMIYLVPFLPLDSTVTSVTIEALRTNDGSPLWSHTFAKDSRTFVHFTIVNNIVYIKSVSDSIEVLRASDGFLLWHYRPPTPFASTVADGNIYVLTQDGHLSALHPGSNAPLWTYALSTSIQSLLPPVVANGSVYLKLEDGGMVAVRADTGRLLWRYTPRVLAQALLPQPLVANGAVYALTQDGHLCALSASSGSTFWRIALHTTNASYSLFAANGVIYVGTPDGSVEAVRESDGSVIWQAQSREGGPISITVAEALIYLTSYTGNGVNVIGGTTVLRESDGLVLWHSTLHVPATQMLPVTAENLVLISLQDGSIEALDARSGSLRWHHVI
jgi:outer membrane protein assembly factor BamB